jgi:predicted Holliday junction resolvase-like endonuclease
MNPDILKFFRLQRQIFGICPNSGEFFRLSDARIYLKSKPPKDWLEKIEDENSRLERREDSLESREGLLRDRARQRGRISAQKAAKKIDSVFTPLRLNPDDAKVIFHPVDYLVFKGMNSIDGDGRIKSLILLDRHEKHEDHKKLQKSVERAVERCRYDWLTLRIQDDGKIKTD